MNALTGMEKFSHLEDKIYLTIEYAKKMRDEKERLEREAGDLRREAAVAISDRMEMAAKIDVLMQERDSVQLKVEAMLDAITNIDSDVAESVRR